MRYSDPPSAAYEKVKEYYAHTTAVDGAEVSLQALGRTADPALARDLFAFAMSPKVALQDAHTPLLAMSANAATRETLWQCVTGQWDTIEAKTGGSTIAIERFARVTLQRYVTRKRADEMRAFFKDKDTSRFSQALGLALNAIEGNASWYERDEARVGEFLSAHGYA